MRTINVPSNDRGPAERPTDAQRVRALLEQLGFSQRGAARDLGIEERTLRYWCSGQLAVPPMALLALERLLDIRRGVVGDPAWIEHALDSAIEQYALAHGRRPKVVELGTLQRIALDGFIERYSSSKPIDKSNPMYDDVRIRRHEAFDAIFPVDE